MGCLLWGQAQVYVLLQSLEWCIQYHVISDRVIMALDCMNDIWVLNNNHMCCSMGDVVPYLYVFVLVAAIRCWLFSAAVRRNAITWTHTDFLLNRPYISGIWIKIPAFFKQKNDNYVQVLMKIKRIWEVVVRKLKHCVQSACEKRCPSAREVNPKDMHTWNTRIDKNW